MLKGANAEGRGVLFGFSAVLTAAALPISIQTCTAYSWSSVIQLKRLRGGFPPLPVLAAALGCLGAGTENSPDCCRDAGSDLGSAFTWAASSAAIVAANAAASAAASAACRRSASAASRSRRFASCGSRSHIRDLMYKI